LALVLISGTAVAIAQEGNTAEPAEETVEDEGLQPFLTGDEEMPPGLAKKLGDNTPPGQAKKDGDFMPPGLAMKGEDWLPPGLAEQGKIPPGHAKRLGVEPTTGTDTDD
jgi:hypothetical protein